LDCGEHRRFGLLFFGPQAQEDSPSPRGGRQKRKAKAAMLAAVQSQSGVAFGPKKQ
jgi:hypothetical protein